MANPKTYTKEEEAFVLSHYQEMTAAEMAERLMTSLCPLPIETMGEDDRRVYLKKVRQTVYNICRANGVVPKQDPSYRTLNPARAELLAQREEKKEQKRQESMKGKPPAQYSNTGYLALAAQYGL